MAKDYSKSKGRGSKERFFGVPVAVISHENWALLTSQGNKLIFDLGIQYYGINNGDLCATWLFMERRGWKSRDTLNDALKELVYYGLLVQTQLGGLNRPSLYGLAWARIDKADKHSDWKVGDRPNTWRQAKSKFIKPSTLRNRKKKQHRIACQSAPNSVSVVSNLKVTK